MWRYLCSSLACGLALSGALFAPPVLAQTDNVRVVIDDVPGGAIVSGCYQAIGSIYGGYSFEFCLEQEGTYEVSGNGIHCEGELTWKGLGTYVTANLKETSCGNGVAWSADSMSCWPSVYFGIWGVILQRDDAFISRMWCHYEPAEGTGEAPTMFLARRLE